MRIYPLKDRNRYWKILFNWVFLDCVIRNAKRNGNSYLVLDQGIFQALWSTQFSTAGGHTENNKIHNLVQQYLERLPVTELTVIHISAPEETIRKRIINREGYSPLDSDPASIANAYQAEHEIVQLIETLELKAPNFPKFNFVHTQNQGEEAVQTLINHVDWF